MDDRTRSALRSELASWPADASTDAHGIQEAQANEMYAPASHAAALDPATPIVRGARGTGKSFWSSVLGKPELRLAAASAYPRIGLDMLDVRFGFTGLPSSAGIDRDKLDECVDQNGTPADARTFWWATLLRAVHQTQSKQPLELRALMSLAADRTAREQCLESYQHGNQGRLLVVYDAIDTVAAEWDRRRMLTQALFEVVWNMRAYSRIRPKLFVRPDQLDDDALTFVEMPKLRSGAVRLAWNRTDLYALLFVRLALGEQREEFSKLLSSISLPSPTDQQVLSRDWIVLRDQPSQRKLMTALAGPYMASGPHGHKKGSTYDWPLNHLADAFDEVTPRSLLALLTGAAQHDPAPPSVVVSPDGLRHGLRLASQMRVDQLHLEFRWIKGVLAPLDGLLLPKAEGEVVKVWKRARTVEKVLEDAKTHHYLPPFPERPKPDESGLTRALESIGVLSRRKDERIDMPDLFRVAARLLKKGGTAPA